MMETGDAQRKREIVLGKNGKGEGRRICLVIHTRMTTTPRACTLDTKRFPGHGGLPKGEVIAPILRFQFFSLCGIYNSNWV